MKDFGAKLKPWLKSHWKELTFFIIFTILNIFFLTYASRMYSISLTSKRSILVLIFSIIAEIAAFMVVLKAKKLKWAIEKVFLILFIPIGLIYLLAIPIGRVPDENAHLTRAYGISIGHFITSANEDGKYGEYLPNDLVALNNSNKTYANTLNIINDTNDNYEFVDDSNIAIYNFFNFIPQSTGFLIGRILSLPAVYSAYLARLLNFICFTALFYFAIKKAPFGKVFFFLIAFLPIVLQEAISLSADCLAIGMSAALISFSLHLAYDKTAKLTSKNYIILLIFIFFESLCKIVYLPLCFLIFLIPTSKFKSKKDHLFRTIIPIIAIIIINLIWLKIASQYLIEYNPGVNSGEQIKFIISSPLSYLQVIFNTCITSMYQFAYGMFGGWLEWLDVEIGHIYLVLTIIISSILVYKNSESKIKISNASRAIIIAIVIATLGLIFTSLYIQWNPVGNGIVGGLQGRYFLPILMLTPAVACGLRKKHQNTTNLEEKENHSLLYLFSVFYSVAAVIIIIFSHLG